MEWDRLNSLGKAVEAKATNRPVKIAYLVPFDDAPQTHMNLDAVFYESYTRWAGVYTLVIPTKAGEFLTDGYREWLKHFDPDFVYSYVDLALTFVDQIDHLCCPIAFLKHKISDRQDHEVNWRSFLPHWDNYIQPISSITTVQSPATHLQLPHEEQPREPTIFTQYGCHPTNRFLADNFGTALSILNVTHAIPGFFKTLCLTPAGLPANIGAGTERCSSTLEALRAISDRKATPISRLAMANSAGMPRIDSLNWGNAFRLFVGSTPLDRIHFWNSRHLVTHDTPNALILEPTFFDDDQLVKQLGDYLNKHSFLSRGNEQHRAEIHSSSVAADVLNVFREKLQPHTWNTVHVAQMSNAYAIPSQKDLDERIYDNTSDTATTKLTEDSSEIAATEPAHFIYIPAQLKELARGQWVVELTIQRHNNLSKYSNVVDTWALPRRRKIAHAFTKRLAKPTLSGRLALVPSSENFPFRGHAIKNRCSYELYLPTDETFFHNLALRLFRYSADDLRASIPRAGYIGMETSDKGQNLRGVISLFGQLPTAFGILTNKFWRAVLAEAKEDSTRPLTFKLDKLCSLIPNDQGTLQRLTQQLRLGNVGKTAKYLRDSMIDTLEHLVRLNVFYQVAHWRCGYCGHSNSRSFDEMKIKNRCDICATEYFAPIDIEWQYELNDFVYRSLHKHAGLSVLWTLGFLQDRMHAGNFWYLPEVDLYESDDDPATKNEADILCMLDGEFYAAEVKRSASLFVGKEGELEKFVKMIGILRPDVALLAFERYCAEGEDEAAIKVKLGEVAAAIRERVGRWTKLEILVAQEVHGFNDFPADLGWFGRRVQKYH